MKLGSARRPWLDGLFDLAAPLIFLGTLQNQPILKSAANEALLDLGKLVYKTESYATQPTRVFSLEGDLSKAYASHGGIFQPYTIYIRSRVAPQKFLRHELAHDASFRNCGRKRQAWEEEAFALWFSEPQDIPSAPPRAEDLRVLRHQIERGMPITARARDTLAALVVIHGFPGKPCATSAVLKKTIGLLPPAEDLAFRLVYFASLRPIAVAGDQGRVLPLGSLWKVPFAASLLPQNEQEIKRINLGLVTSDPAYFRGIGFDSERFAALTGVKPRADLTREVFVGLRDEHLDYPFEASLTKATEIMRAALLSRPNLYRDLSQHQRIKGSTLANLPSGFWQEVHDLNALIKTGTVSTGGGEPLWGYAMVAFPAQAPEFLAVFRNAGYAGHDVARLALKALSGMSRDILPSKGIVKVHVLTQSPKQGYEVLGDPMLAGEYGLSPVGFSRDGELKLRVYTTSPDPERRYLGFWNLVPGAAPVLYTDPESYADGVMASEASDLPFEARKALRAIVVWNGLNAAARLHPAKFFGGFSGLCDTTHCSVFHGSKTAAGDKTDWSLVRSLARHNSAGSWLMFALGGDGPWTVTLGGAKLKQRLGVDVVSLTRLREKSGAVVIQVHGRRSDQLVTCEDFRAKLKLASCPDSIKLIDAGMFEMKGHGAGHGKGFNITEAARLARSGMDARGLLQRFF